jgi:hypothetical protein
MTSRQLIQILQRIESHHGGELPVRLDYAHTYKMDFKDPKDKPTKELIKQTGQGPTVEFYINLP